MVWFIQHVYVPFFAMVMVAVLVTAPFAWIMNHTAGQRGQLGKVILFLILLFGAVPVGCVVRDAVTAHVPEP